MKQLARAASIASIASILAASRARAQPTVAETPAQAANAAPESALEVTLGAGWAQGLGNFTRAAGDGVSDTSGVGAAVEAGLGARISTRWVIGLYGSWAQFQRSDLLAPGSSVRSATGGVEAQLHLAPFARIDPWIGLGAGYRFHAVSPDFGDDYVRHGLQLARLRLGLDYRVSRAFALGPAIGADLTMTLWQRIPGQGLTAVSGSDLGNAVFFFGGLQGRFDAIDGPTSATGLARR